MLNRRRWIQSLSLLGMGPSISLAAGWSAGPGKWIRAASVATRGALPVGELFVLDATKGPIPLRLAGLLEGPVSEGVDQFGLVFVDRARSELSASTYSLRHRELGKLSIYLEPMSGSAASSVYIAEFGLLKRANPYVRDLAQLWPSLRAA